MSSQNKEDDNKTGDAETPSGTEKSPESKQETEKLTATDQASTESKDAKDGPAQVNDNAKNQLKKDEELEKLKAEKVIDMIEPIKVNDQLHSRMIYLTNWQANAISNSETSIKNLIDSLCEKKQPKLIIHLVQSWGFYNSTTLQDEEMYKKEWSAGVMYNTPPFKDNDNLRELSSTMTRLTHFMSEVIIPLAERTNALVICSAVADDCVLTETFIGALQAHSSRWDGNAFPFTVLKMLNQVHFLYKKVKIEGKYMKGIGAENKNCKCVEWTGFMDQNTNWKRRHQHLEKHFELEKKGVDKKEWWRGHDLDWSDGNLLVVEGLEKSTDGGFTKNQAPFGLLLTSILDTYSHIPSLAIKTGATPRRRLNQNANAIDTMGYPYLVNRVNSETHVILLDVRDREGEEGSFNNFDGETLDDDIIGQLFPKRPTCESLDCCTLAFLGEHIRKHDSNAEKHLSSSSNASKSSNDSKRGGKKSLKQPQEQSISFSSNASKSSNDSKGGVKKSLRQRLKDGRSQALHEKDYRRYSNISYQFCSEFLKRTQKDEKKKLEDFNGFHLLTSNIGTLLTSKLFHCKNIFEKEDKLTDDIEKEILFTYHRQRAIPPYEGLKLLEKAWEYVDKTKADAVGYEKITTCLTLLQICLGLLITILTAIAAYMWNENEDEDETLSDLEFWLTKATLLITLLLTAVVSIESLLTPKSMWRQLRLKSVQLESLIWRYRAGVQEFEPVLDTQRDPEDNFDKALVEWKEDLHIVLNNVGATMIPQNIQSLKSSVPYYMGYKKKWTSDEVLNEHGDDHYSYVLSKKYLEFRLEPLIKIYDKRIPKHVWMQQRFQIYIIVVGIAIAFVNELDTLAERTVVILILTAIVAAIKAWSAFRDIEGDLQLYPRAINAMRNKQMEWETRTMHQRQDMGVHEELVVNIENIAKNVVESWSKTLSEQKYDIPSSNKDGDTNGGESKKGLDFTM